MKKDKGFIDILLIAVAVVIIGGGTFYYINNQKTEELSSDTDLSESFPVVEENNQDYESEQEMTFCTSDAMQCPDGSYVGRTGPNCEFVCPDNDIGITITFPPADYLTKPPVNVKGYVNDVKKWTVFESNAGSAELYGIYNGVETKIGSAPIPLLDFDYDKEPPFYFDILVGDRQWISELDNEYGYVLIKEDGVKDGVITDEIRIPIKFDIPANI